MVETVVPGLAGQFRVTVVFLEKTDGLAIADAYYDFALLTILTRRTVGTDQVDIVVVSV